MQKFLFVSVFWQTFFNLSLNTQNRTTAFSPYRWWAVPRRWWKVTDQGTADTALPFGKLAKNSVCTWPSAPNRPPYSLCPVRSAVSLIRYSIHWIRETLRVRSIASLKRGRAYLSGADFISGVSDNPFETELGVLEGVVDEGKIPAAASASSFTGVLLEKSKLLLIGAVVSVGCNEKWNQYEP